MTARDPFVLAAFQYLGPNGTVGAGWYEEEDRSADFLTLGHWTSLARRLDEAGFDFLFLADSHGWPAVDGQPHPAAVREGRGVPQADPVTVISALAAVTERLGFVVTSSTTVERPAALARRLATLDHFCSGRLGWNIVTGSNGASAAALMGEDLISHDLRYDMAEDYLELCLGLWEGTWRTDAYRRDPSTRTWADPDGVRALTHEGPYFRSHGILNLPPSPQRTPLLVQAGSSGRGLAYAGRNAEAVFVAGGDPLVVARRVAAIRRAAADAGRDPRSVKVLAGVMLLAAETSAEAHARHTRMLERSTLQGAAAVFAGNTGVDLLQFPLDRPLPPDLTTDQGLSNLQRYLGTPEQPGPTVAQILEDFRTTGLNGTVIAGDPEEVVDGAVAFADATDVDGFLLQPDLVPGTFEAVADLVVPVLRERGLAREAPTGATLREHLFGEGHRWLAGDHHGSGRRWVAPAEV
ncbi:NtaA/DmoA family FMN-dependent monooxygenase [Nocardioides sp. GY 10127]|uniref:NtaA/DmoA family FMN-dependent monooxygenase n=1 Tax=Nocardioides sp. GY 10127 TaxID=2569762 RepID=UPI0010A87FE1|nr:NtaA/DmoA family FMN-dependent monooxygenase [Nocardioides sp. GY 10127]TIC79111.1 LLM class flavin-dependent oxidoreductase [Nocardioides sp. GY 10127]